MKLRGIFFLAASSILILAFARFAASADTADDRCDQLFTALRRGDFAGATAHFDATMKSGLSPDQLGQVWFGIVAADGRLLKWEVVQRGKIHGVEVRSVELSFEHGKQISTVSVRPENGEIAGLFFRPVQDSSSASHPPYADADKFRALDVTLRGSAYPLPAILTVPSGPGRSPAAVLIAGSGPNDRDETIGPNHVFKDLAEGLSSHGIVVLRYDKRTFAYRNIDPQKITVDQEVIEDGVGAVAMLRARKEVLADRVFLIGHSLGAELAPEIAKKAWPVAGIVMLAPLGRKLPQTIVQQMRFLGQSSPAEMAELERQADQIAEHQMRPTDMFFHVPVSYIYDLDARDEVSIARSLDVPILILHGGRDYQVIDQDIRHWQDGLKGIARVKVETFPALNHLFIAGEGPPNPTEYSKPGHVDASVIKAIADFVSDAGARK